MKLMEFRVLNYRNVHDSGWIEVSALTALVGQNESGKSNLCEALYRLSPFDPRAKYIFNEDWPADRWGQKDKSAVVCEAKFLIENSAQLMELFAAAGDGSNPPDNLVVKISRTYEDKLLAEFEGEAAAHIDASKGTSWVTAKMPKCVYIHEYELSGTQVELDGLASRFKQQGWNNLNNEDKTILTILELANINLDDFVSKGATAEGRTLRAFDKRQASAYLTTQFARLWRQKKVRFDIEVDATTLNIFVEDEGLGMPVRLSRRSTGFRWYVSFAWNFTHATKGAYKDTVLLLEEPGVHLHHAGHSDLLDLFEELSQHNTIIYTTHLSTMLDPAFPERIRIVEVHNHHAHVLNGMVSKQKQPMMVIEATLGLSGSMSGLLGNRQTLIVEGGDDAIILQKLSGMLARAGKEGLSERIYPFPAQGAPKTPMYAALMVGHKWDAGVLLDSDGAGEEARKKISELYLKELAEGQKFRVFMLGKAAGIPKNEAAIEDIFPEEFYLECVNAAYGTAIKPADLPVDGSTLIAKRVETVLVEKHARKALDKGLVMGKILAHFDSWKSLDDVPRETVERATKLFKAINAEFA